MEPRSSGLVLEMKRVITAPAPLVFAALSEANELAKWWGPEGYTVPSLIFRGRVGDSYRIEMQPPEGDASASPGSSARSPRRVASPTRSSTTPRTPTMSRRSLLCRFKISADRRRSHSSTEHSRPRPVARFITTVGRRASTGSIGSSDPAELERRSPPSEKPGPVPSAAAVSLDGSTGRLTKLDAAEVGKGFAL